MNTFAKYAPHITRSLLGLMFLVFGLNGFLNFLPQPPAEGAALEFLGGLGASGYFFPFLKGTEILIGLALLGNRFVPLALTVLAPITVNIVAYHIFLAPAGMGMVALIVALQVYSMWSYRAYYAAVLKAVASPAGGEVEAIPHPTNA